MAIHFNASITFLRLVLENSKKYHKGDFAGTAPYLITFDPYITMYITVRLKMLYCDIGGQK